MSFRKKYFQRSTQNYSDDAFDAVNVISKYDVHKMELTGIGIRAQEVLTEIERRYLTESLGRSSSHHTKLNAISFQNWFTIIEWVTELCVPAHYGWGKLNLGRVMSGVAFSPCYVWQVGFMFCCSGV